MDSQGIPSSGVQNGAPYCGEQFSADRPGTADKLERPSTVMSISEEHELGQESMMAYFRLHMTGILQPFADSLDGVHNSIDGITGEIGDLTRASCDHKSSLDWQSELIDGLRNDLGSTQEQLRATQLQLQKTISEQNALEAAHGVSQDKIGKLEDDARSIHRSIRDLWQGIEDSSSALEAKMGTRHDQMNEEMQRLSANLAQLNEFEHDTREMIEYNKLAFDTHLEANAPLPQELRSLHAQLEQHIMDCSNRLRALEDEDASIQKSLLQYHQDSARRDFVEQLTGRVDAHDAVNEEAQRRFAGIDGSLADQNARTVENGENFNKLFKFMEQRHATDSHEIHRLLDTMECDMKESRRQIKKEQEESEATLMEEINFGFKRSLRIENVLGIEPLRKDNQEEGAGLHLRGGILLSDEQIANIRATFDRFDADSSGTISTEEISEILKSMGQDPSPEVLDVIVHDMDPDRSGEINFDEFCTLMAKMLSPDGTFELETYLHNVSEDAAREVNQRKMVQLVPVMNEEIRSHKGMIELGQIKLEGASERIQSLEGDHAGLVNEVEKLRKGLELTQEYWKGMTRGLKETKKCVRTEDESELIPSRTRLRILPPLERQAAATR